MTSSSQTKKRVFPPKHAQQKTQRLVLRNTSSSKKHKSIRLLFPPRDTPKQSTKESFFPTARAAVNNTKFSCLDTPTVKTSFSRTTPSMFFGKLWHSDTSGRQKVCPPKKRPVDKQKGRILHRNTSSNKITSRVRGVGGGKKLRASAHACAHARAPRCLLDMFVSCAICLVLMRRNKNSA